MGNCIWYYDVYFLNQDIGFICGVPGVLMRTDDGGQSWRELTPVTDRFLYRIHFVDSQHGWISAAGGVMIRTRDGGLTWERTYCGTSYGLANVFFLDDGFTGWLCGDYVTILKTTTGGFPVVIPETKKPQVNERSTYRFHQNFPNPFNSTTTVEFYLPEAGETTLKIFNIIGEEVATLVNGRLSAGTHSFHWDASGHPSGVYLYRLKTGEIVKTKKMILIQ